MNTIQLSCLVLAFTVAGCLARSELLDRFKAMGAPKPGDHCWPKTYHVKEFDKLHPFTKGSYYDIFYDSENQRYKAVTYYKGQVTKVRLIQNDTTYIQTRTATTLCCTRKAGVFISFCKNNHFVEFESAYLGMKGSGLKTTGYKWSFFHVDHAIEVHNRGDKGDYFPITWRTYGALNHNLVESYEYVDGEEKIKDAENVFKVPYGCEEPKEAHNEGLTFGVQEF